MITIEMWANVADLAELRRDYAETLAGRLEPYIEEHISSGGVFHSIAADGEVIGYFCISESRTLLQFHVVERQLPHAHEAFARLVGAGLVDKALIYTRDRLALSLSLEFQKGMAVDDYIFDDGSAPPSFMSELSGTTFRQATAADVPLIRATVGDFHDFLHYTLEGSIAKGEIFMLLAAEVLLGTGVISDANTQPPYVDVGMCVGEAHRRKNVGTHIVMKLREHCHKHGLVPGASCKLGNVASRKTLEKAGLVSRDRILKITF